MNTTTRNSMTPHYEAGPVRIFHGDCIDVMRGLPDNSVDAVVTDPPYGLGFMGKEWDDLPPGLDFAIEAFRLLKPGGHILAFGGSRTWHRLAVAIEDAGFEIRDSIAWLYGSGFPKSMDVSKAIDKASGEEVTIRPRFNTAGDVGEGNARDGYNSHEKHAAKSDEAKVWEGWGTALKPAFEPVVVGRKPLQGTVAGNVLAYGVGALNIDATRVQTDEDRSRPPRTPNALYGGGKGTNLSASESNPAGRWPANVVLDETRAAELDKQSGVLTSHDTTPGGEFIERNASSLYELGHKQTKRPVGRGDSGGASRFFPTFRYEAKAPGSERPTADGVSHPTVKPLDLMRWLVRLVTPPGGVVLEPFAGSGTTVEACIREGFGCIAIEREADYLPLILKRVRKDHEQSLFGDDWDAA